MSKKSGNNSNNTMHADADTAWAAREYAQVQWLKAQAEYMAMIGTVTEDTCDYNTIAYYMAMARADAYKDMYDHIAAMLDN